MSFYKKTCAVGALFFFLMIFKPYSYAQSIGYNDMYLGLPYENVKNILIKQDYLFNEFNVGSIRIIKFNEPNADGLLVFDFFGRLFTVIITIPISDQQFKQLEHHLTRTYGEFIHNDSYSWKDGIYTIELYHDTMRQNATVVYGHTIPLFFNGEPVPAHPFSKF